MILYDFAVTNFLIVLFFLTCYELMVNYVLHLVVIRYFREFCLNVDALCPLQTIANL